MKFWFAIPLRSQKVSLDWEHVTRLLDATVSSALASKEADVRIVIACSEIPDITHKNDPRVSFVSRSYPVPKNSAHQMLDKRLKKYDMARFVCEQGGGYMMLLDSDDLVSNRLASFVLKDNNNRGYLVKDGFIVDAETGEIESTSRFDQICGSSSIFWLTQEDADSPSNWPLYITVTRHQDFMRLSKDTLRPLDIVPFPAALALKNNGENHSFRFGGKGKAGWRTRIRRIFDFKKPALVSSAVSEEFCYYLKM